MKDNKKIEAAKKLIELMQAYIKGENIEKLINDHWSSETRRARVPARTAWLRSQTGRLRPGRKRLHSFFYLLTYQPQARAAVSVATAPALG